MSPPAKTIFLDRDGTLIVDKNHAFRPDNIELLDSVVEGLALLQEARYRLVVITNQSGVARGYFTEEDVCIMHRRIREVLLGEGIRLKDFYYCPHHPEGVVPRYSFRCRCRKPEPGMILQAARDQAIDLPRSWVIGDAVTDAGAGFAAGCRSVLLKPAAGSDPCPPFATAAARNLLEAAELILSYEMETTYGKSSRYHASV